MLFTASNVHKSSHGCVHILSAPAWGAQEQPGELVAGLPVLEHHRCHPPSMQPTHHTKAQAVRQLSNRFTPGEEDKANCLTERSLNHLLSTSSLRLITGNPPRQVLQKTLVLIRKAAQGTHGSALCSHHPDRAPSIPLPQPPPQR